MEKRYVYLTPELAKNLLEGNSIDSDFKYKAIVDLKDLEIANCKPSIAIAFSPNIIDVLRRCKEVLRSGKGMPVTLEEVIVDEIKIVNKRSF